MKKKEEKLCDLLNLLINLYSKEYSKYFEELWFDENKINELSKDELEKLTKIAAIIEYVGNRQPEARLYDWIYSKKFILNYPFTPGVEIESAARVKRILYAPREFSCGNVSIGCFLYLEFYALSKTVTPLCLFY